MTDIIDNRMPSFTEADEGRSLDTLKTELAKLRKPHNLGGRVGQYMAGGAQRIEQLENLIGWMERNGKTTVIRPEAVETVFQRRIRESIEAEDAEQAAREVDEPPSDLESALAARAKALAQMDRALDALASARAAEVAAVDVILTHAQGRGTREFVHLGHSSAALMARLGDIGIARDVRWDKSAPSPRLAGLAECHKSISQQTKPEAA